jgi:hypothetical protein
MEEDSGGRGRKSKRRGHRSETEDVSNKHKKKKKKKSKVKHRKRKRDEQQPAHARTKREKLTKRLFAAISRCGSGRAAGGDAATDVHLHDVRYYTARLLRLAASASSSADAALVVVVDDTGRTPLHRAVMQDNAALCRYLIDALGRDVVNMVAGSEVP